MYVRQITDRTVFLKKASEKRREVRVLRTATVLPRQQGNAVLMTPATALRYSMVLEAEGTEPQQEWVYEEVRYENDQGQADLSTTLIKDLEQLRTEGTITLVFVSRSGSS
jgi:hypothetical protein